MRNLFIARPLAVVALLYFVTALFRLAGVPWKYEFDFHSYLLGMFLFPLFLTGLYVFVSTLFGRMWGYRVALPVFLLFIFPGRAVVKVLLDQPSPWGVVSPLLGILVLAAGYRAARRTERWWNAYLAKGSRV